MPQILIRQKDLPDIARTYGDIYETNIGQIAFTQIVDPKGIVLLAKGDQLRFYMFKKPGGVWELIWGASSIVKEGLPTSEGLIQWKVQHALRAGLQGLTDAEALSRAELDEAAEIGTEVHDAAEALWRGQEVVLASRPTRQVEHIVSLANFINDHQFRNASTERIVAFDKVIVDEFGNKIRIVFGGRTDLIVEIYNEKLEKWETWLIDYKTSKEAHLSHKIQALGYSEAVAQSYGIKIDRIGILLLGRRTRTGYALVEVGKERKHKLTFNDFVLAYRMALLVNNGALPAPSYKTYPTTIKLIQDKEVKDVGSNNNTDNHRGDDDSGDGNKRPAGRTKAAGRVGAELGAQPKPRAVKQGAPADDTIGA